MVALAGAAGVVAPGVWGVAVGSPVLRTGGVGVIVACALALYLLIARAGRAMVGAVAAVGVLLALFVPRAAADALLAQRGQISSVVVTSVAVGRDDRSGTYYCSVRHANGTPIGVRIRRGCGETTQPGDLIAMVYDPEGRVRPRGRDTSGPSLPRPLVESAGLMLALALLSYVAVVRSYRLEPV